MDFKDSIQQLSERIAKQQDAIVTEEGTKKCIHYADDCSTRI